MPEMTPEFLRATCKKNGGYTQPTLNDQLFLQCCGFTKIENLEPYTNIKVLWLEQNGISDIEGLDANTKLVSLFLQNNAIRRISGLTTLSNLRILNLSHNFIASLDGLAESCPQLETLQCSHNQLTSLAACENLWKLADTLSSVDLSFNRIVKAADAAPPPAGQFDLTIVEFFQHLPNVSVIYLQGNEISHTMRQYRKNMIVHLTKLTYLDERPVFPEERRATEAWGVGGDKAEQDERAKIRQEKKDELTNSVQTMVKAMEANRETRDRLTAQWEARREEEHELNRQRRAEVRKMTQALDKSEYDSRTTVEIEENDAWFDLESDLEDAYTKVLKQEAAWKAKHQQLLDVESVRQQVDRELHEQEERLAEVLRQVEESEQRVAELTGATTKKQTPVEESPTKKPQHVDPVSTALSSPSKSTSNNTVVSPSKQNKSKTEQTLEYWIKQLDQSDEEVLRTMEDDLQKYLNELHPGMPAPRVTADAVHSATATSGQQQVGKKTTPTRKASPQKSGMPTAADDELYADTRATTRHVTQRGIREAVAVTAASIRDGTAAVVNGGRRTAPQRSRESLWETYYAWETRQRK